MIVPWESLQLEWLFTKLIKESVKTEQGGNNGIQYWTTFHMLIYSLYIFWGRCSNISPTFYLSFLFFCGWVLRLFGGYILVSIFFFIRYEFSRYLPPICGLSSHSLNSFKREVLILIKCKWSGKKEWDGKTELNGERLGICWQEKLATLTESECYCAT